MTNNLYLTKVGLISGGIGSRGPESGWAPGGGAGGRGGKALMVRKFDFFLQVDYLKYVLVQIDLICTCPSHRARKAQRQPRAHRSPRCLGKSEDKHYYDHHYEHHYDYYHHLSPETTQDVAKSKVRRHLPDRHEVFQLLDRGIPLSQPDDRELFCLGIMIIINLRNHGLDDMIESE